MESGKVYLVGAGPGDPGLITVKGQELLAGADVVVYDRLLSESLLDKARPEAERIYVGKSPGRHAMGQAEINRLLVQKAREGKMVVRLKGGDPFVFGRGGEEAEALVDAGLPFEIVPGVSAAVAAPAYAGIPVTHRRLASSFTVVTGHEDPSREISRLDWSKLAGGGTLVLMMGVQNLAPIVEKLVSGGLPSRTPVAIVEQGTGPRQRTLVGTLGNIVAKAEKAELRPPAVTVVGRVVRLRDKLRWFDNRPLFGRRILVTRSRQQASTLCRLLSQQGAEPLEVPAIAIEPADEKGLAQAIARLESYTWLVFTSINAVEALFTALSRQQRDVRALRGLKLCAIGPATAAGLENHGLKADYVPAEYTTKAILGGLKEKARGERVLLVRAEGVSDEMVTGLSRAGVQTDQVAAYRTVSASEGAARVKRLLEEGEIDMVTFTSSSTVRGLAGLLGGGPGLSGLKGVKVACIGPVTAATARELGLKVDVMAREHTMPGLVRAIVEYYNKANPKS
ncbi:MAG: uroporphyrinogen-III C-methyltransferase [Dehalococcoidia bacterium]|nr:uroporphyrinogen-III C-methyltransferase [Dehalococcoidia bacterium]